MISASETRRSVVLEAIFFFPLLKKLYRSTARL
jgi:hypothetical protein